MNKRRKRKSTYLRRFRKPLIRGKFYKISDSNGGHYSRLYRKNTKKNKYWIIRFTESEGRHRKELLHQIDPFLENRAKSFVITQPEIVKYEHFKHPYPYEQLRVHKEDRKTVKRIEKKK